MALTIQTQVILLLMMRKLQNSSVKMLKGNLDRYHTDYLFSAKISVIFRMLSENVVIENENFSAKPLSLYLSKTFEWTL